jgi:hypothetical protein
VTALDFWLVVLAVIGGNMVFDILRGFVDRDEWDDE